MPVDKKAARREFKERKPQVGIFAVRCEPAGQTWVGRSTHLDTEQNSLWFQLNAGSVAKAALQQAWKQHGAEAFQYEVLETFKDDVVPLTLRDLFKEREKAWADQLGAAVL